MALTFNPVSVNLPTPSSFAGAPMGAPVNPNALSSLADLTNIQSTQQGIATSEQALKKAQATYGADVSKAESEAKQKAIEAQNAAFDYQNKEYNAFQTVISPHASDASVLAASKLTPQSTPEEVKKVQEGLLNLGESTVKELMNRGVSKIRAYQLVAPHFAETMTDPKLAAQNINLAVQKLAGPANIASQNQPNYGVNAAGQTTSIIPAQGGNSFQVVQPDNVANAPAPAGAIPAGVAPTNAAPVPRPNPNPSTAQVGMANAASKTLAEDFNKTQMEANEAQPRIATFQNIKKLVPDAFTGVGGERKKFLAGVANAINVDVYTLENSTTDELAKNSAILQLAGGNTDAARAIASIANPSGKMTKDAIINITDQMIGMEKLKEAKANFLAPVSNDPAAYQRKLSQFNLVNDYRIFQESNPEQIKKLKASMSQEEQNAISAKIKLARQMGLIR